MTLHTTLAVVLAGPNGAGKSTSAPFLLKESRDGRELFYRQDDVMMVVPIGSDPTRAGTPQRLFDFPALSYGLDRNRVEYDVGADGRFLATRQEGLGRGQEIRVVTNWLVDRTRAVATTRP